MVSGATTLEQLIGRTHREGQEADQVTVDVLVGCLEHLTSWDKALEGAAAAVELQGQTQKILIADKIFPDDSERKKLCGHRWEIILAK